MAKKKAIGKNTQAAYVAEGREFKNARRRLERHLKRFPNDEVAKRALKNVSNKEHRKAPSRNGGWDHVDSNNPTWGDKKFAHMARRAGLDRKLLDPIPVKGGKK